MTKTFFVNDPKANARQAAERFGDARGRVVKWLNMTEFRFVDGTKVYRIVMLRDGWKIEESA